MANRITSNLAKIKKHSFLNQFSLFSRTPVDVVMIRRLIYIKGPHMDTLCFLRLRKQKKNESIQVHSDCSVYSIICQFIHYILSFLLKKLYTRNFSLLQ